MDDFASILIPLVFFAAGWFISKMYYEKKDGSARGGGTGKGAGNVKRK